MPFNVILKQLSDPNNPNHFQYQSLVAFNTRLDSEMRQANINKLMSSLTTTDTDETYFVFTLENLEDRFDESVIGRVVTTRQLIDILQTDEFVEDTADCALLLGGITVNHYLIMQAGIVYDTGLEDEEIEWTPDAFVEHYQHSLWRIYD
jgi:UPF0288 family protein (methanogenesis marker protein 3)